MKEKVSNPQLPSEKMYPSTKSIRLLLLLIQICGFRKQDIQSLIDPIVQTRLFVLFETEKNSVNFPM